QSLEAASRNHAQADARFKAGLGSSVELADAETLLVQAEIDLAVGRFEHARARARLSRALSEEAGARTRTKTRKGTRGGSRACCRWRWRRTRWACWRWAACSCTARWPRPTTSR